MRHTLPEEKHDNEGMLMGRISSFFLSYDVIFSYCEIEVQRLQMQVLITVEVNIRNFDVHDFK